MHHALNAILFQVAWFGTVIGAASGNPLWGLLGLIGLIVLSIRNGSIGADLELVAVLTIAGLALEHVWIDQHILAYGEAFPTWILLLWIAVALTLNHSLSWFQSYPATGAVLAALAAPMSYLGGQQLGAVAVTEPLKLIWVSLCWSALFFLVFRLGSSRSQAATTPPSHS